MEINQPDRGVFKGIGRLQKNPYINRKIFPKLRNQHQFLYTHDHHNDYKTSNGAFKQFGTKQYHNLRIKGNQNKTNFQLGTDSNKQISSENKRCFRKYQYSMPPKSIKQPQEGIAINQYQQRTGEKLKNYSTANKQAFNTSNTNRESDSTIYKYARAEKFNPITGQFKGYNKTNYGFEDYAPNSHKKYRANNLTMISERHDIITGRKLTHA